jgi:suppressor for copper-sensitivity B
MHPFSPRLIPRLAISLCWFTSVVGLAWMNSPATAIAAPPFAAQQDPPVPKDIANDNQGKTSGKPNKNSKSKSSLKGMGRDLGLGLGLDDGADLNSKPFEYTARYEAEEGGLRGRVSVSVALKDGHHTFSTTQPPGSALPTDIKITSPGITLAGPFTPNNSFDVSTTEEGFEGKRSEIHHSDVTWTAPVTFANPLGSAPAPIKVKISAQVCKKSCIPVLGLEVDAVFTDFYPSPNSQKTVGPFRESGSPVTWTVSLSKSVVAPGEAFEIVLSATPDAQYHIYKLSPMDPSTESRTVFALTQKSGLHAKPPVSDQAPIHKDLGGGVEVDYYPKQVTFRIPLHMPSESIEGIYPLQGLIGYQGCTNGSCDQPRGIRFQVDLTVGKDPKSGPIDATLVAVPFKEVASHPQLWSWIDEDRVKLTLSPIEILSKFCLAMLGGLILNFMPCVLPVIGLKILGFVGEAGGDRKKSSMLTLTYAAGIISLILGLGLLSVMVRFYTGSAFGWGQQFGSIIFRAIITAFMFSLALSFLGVWEIPIPGFAMSKTSTELSNREGYAGAFFKGLITTILATPCSAPFLGGVFLVALSQPAWVVLLIFFGVGLGMALPYLVIAAQPGMLSFLPKPGAWMETFKEFMAFPMLLSVVFLVSGFLDEDRISMLSSLMFVWFACWLIGRVPAWAEQNVKIRNWGVAIAVSVLGSLGSFYYLQPSPYRLAWQQFDESKLEQLVGEGKTVMIDFTANWCANCKTNLHVAIETKRVKELLEEKGIVPMVADLTNHSPVLQAKLRDLDSIAIPILAIYSGADLKNPIVLRDLLSETQVLDALKEASAESDSVNLTSSKDSTDEQVVQ